MPSAYEDLLNFYDSAAAMQSLGYCKKKTETINKIEDK
jgi:hypothetical protein